MSEALATGCFPRDIAISPPLAIRGHKPPGVATHASHHCDNRMRRPSYGIVAVFGGWWRLGAHVSHGVTGYVPCLGSPSSLSLDAPSHSSRRNFHPAPARKPVIRPKHPDPASLQIKNQKSELLNHKSKPAPIQEAIPANPFIPSTIPKPSSFAKDWEIDLRVMILDF